NSLAEAHIAKGRYEEAAKVLERLIQREPQNAQHRNKLSFVQSQMGGVDTVPGRIKEPAPATPAPLTMPRMDIDEPVPTFHLDEGEIDAARAAANQYVAVLQEKGDTATIEAVRSDFVARGHALTAPPRPAPTPRPAAPPPPPPPAPEPVEEELSFDLDAAST